MDNDIFGGPFWGKAAQMGVKMLDGRILERNSLVFPEGKIPLMRKPHPDEGNPRDIIGVIEHMWYGDESGLQTIYFDGHWLKAHEEYLREYPDNRWPALSANKCEFKSTPEGQLITSGQVTQLHLTDRETWLGSTSTFIFDKKLPPDLRNRGRMI